MIKQQKITFIVTEHGVGMSIDRLECEPMHMAALVLAMEHVIAQIKAVYFKNMEQIIIKEEERHG